MGVCCVSTTNGWFPFSWHVLENKVKPVFDIKIRITQVLAWDCLLSPENSCLSSEFGLEEPVVLFNPTHSVTVISDHYNGEELNTIIKHRMGKVCNNGIGICISTKHSKMQFWAGSWTRWSPELLSKWNHSIWDVFYLNISLTTSLGFLNTKLLVGKFFALVSYAGIKERGKAIEEPT